MDNNRDIYNLIIENIENLLSTHLTGEGKDIVIKGADNVIFQITNPKNELELLKNSSNNINNLSIIDLGECETILKKEYHIKENDSLIFIKYETQSGKASKKMLNMMYMSLIIKQN